ncbi:MAG: hypothetical protein HKM95_08460 [Inquilinus sp.]|nr:hypothetical protein [Inquilinus sp.]
MARLRNPRREAFARLLAAGVEPVSAYVTAGYSQRGAAKWARRLADCPAVAARVTGLRRVLAGGPGIPGETGEWAHGEGAVGGTADCGGAAAGRGWVIGLLVETAERALQPVPATDRKGAPTGAASFQGTIALKALELLGREFGMFGGRNGPPVEDMGAVSDAELERRARRLAEALGMGGDGEGDREPTGQAVAEAP